MYTRQALLAHIHGMTMEIKNTSSRNKRFELLDTIAILSDILKDVSTFERGLIIDLDVD